MTDTDYHALGISAYHAVTSRCVHVAYLRGAPVEVVERLFLPADVSAAVQVAQPISERRRQFRAGYAEAMNDDHTGDLTCPQ